MVDFGSWTYDGTKLDLQPDGADMDMSEYLVNGEWNLYRKSIAINSFNPHQFQTPMSNDRRNFTVYTCK